MSFKKYENKALPVWFPLTVAAIVLHKTIKELNRFRIKILISALGKGLKWSLE